MAIDRTSISVPAVEAAAEMIVLAEAIVDLEEELVMVVDGNGIYCFEFGEAISLPE